MRALRTVTLFLSAALASCAPLTTPVAAQNKCGNPCAAVSCPSAFRCDVDAQCYAHCVPEPAPRH